MTTEVKKVTTPEFRACYIYVFEPRPVKEGEAQKTEYGVQALFDKSEDMMPLKLLAQNALKAKFPDYTPGKPGYKSPFRDGDTDPTFAERPECKGKVVINLRSKKRQPGVVDRNLQPILGAKDEVYSGCYMRATVTAYAYNHNGNKGVSFALHNLQKIRDGEAIGFASVKAENDFETLSPQDSAFTASNADQFGDI